MDWKEPLACGIMMRVVCHDSADALAQACASRLADELQRPASAPTAVMLSGGSTPLAAYRLLASSGRRAAPSSLLLFSDDRHVPPEDPRSNYGTIRPLLHAFGVADPQILHVHGERPLDEATDRYHHDLDACLRNAGEISLGLLGLGTDGHTASLFTPDDLDRGAGRWAVAVQRPDGMSGVSVTPEFLHKVRRLIFLVAGPDKRAILERLVRQPTTVTAGRAVAGHPAVELWTDRAAWPFADRTGRAAT